MGTYYLVKFRQSWSRTLTTCPLGFFRTIPISESLKAKMSDHETVTRGCMLYSVL